MTGIRPVAYGSPEYEATVELRRAVLRRPLGLDFTAEQLRAEADDLHLAMFEGETAIGCLVLTSVSPLPSGGEGEGGEGQGNATPSALRTLQMRQVAVDLDRQGQGIGRRLVETSEALATLRGFTRIILHARETAVPSTSPSATHWKASPSKKSASRTARCSSISSPKGCSRNLRGCAGDLL